MPSRYGCAVQVMEWRLKFTTFERAVCMGVIVGFVCVRLVKFTNLEFEVLASSVLPIVYVFDRIGALVVSNGCHVVLGEVPVDHLKGGLCPSGSLVYVGPKCWGMKCT